MSIPSNHSETSLALLRRYTASHAVFNSLSALQLCLLSNDAAAGLDLLRHHSGYLRALTATARCAVCADVADEHRLLTHFAWLENRRNAGQSVLHYDGRPGTGRVASFILLPFLEFQELRNPKGGEIKAQLLARNGEATLVLQVDFSLPARNPVWNEEQTQRRAIWLERLQHLNDDGICRITWQETDKEASITLNQLNHESCNCR